MYLSQHDIFTGLICIAVIAAVLASIELAVKNKLLGKLWGRKLLHCTAICSCVWCINSFENRQALAFIFLGFFFILLWVIKKKWLQINHYKTYGIALFPLAFAVLLFTPVFTKNTIVYAGLILATSDAIASIAGEYFGKQKINFLFESKSWAGFTAFYISAVIISLWWYNFSLHHILLCMLLALLPAATELFSYRGSDNFTVPVFTAVWMLLIQYLSNNDILIFIFCILLFAALAIFAAYKKWLTISGTMAACWMALLLFIIGGFKAFIAPGIFFVCGSLLSKLNAVPGEKNGRNAKQVFANGITGVLLLILYKINNDTAYLITAIISFCISMADSVSSEIGFYLKGATYDILSFKKTAPGVSGGISFWGTVAGLAGAVLMAFATMCFYNFSIGTFFIIGIAGFTGMLADSILGSKLQAKYKLPGGQLSDERGDKAVKIKGYYWCTNDAVNIMSNILTAGLFFYILKQIL